MVTDKESGTRNTAQRTKILEYVRSVHSHPTAEMVYEAVKKELSSISLGTVYRNLNRLAEQGKLIKLEINNEFRFDAELKDHLHCVCSRCGGIDDIHQKKVADYAMKTLGGHDFKPSRVDIIVNGLCAKCA